MIKSPFWSPDMPSHELLQYSSLCKLAVTSQLFLSLLSGIIGSGVCVFSQFPIIDVFTYRFSLNGYLYNVHHGDWFGGKSAGYCLIDHPKVLIHFFTTHVSIGRVLYCNWNIPAQVAVQRAINFQLSGHFRRVVSVWGQPILLESHCL